MAGTIKASTKRAAKNMRTLKIGDIIRVIDTSLLDAPFLKVAAINEDEETGAEVLECHTFGIPQQTKPNRWYFGAPESSYANDGCLWDTDKLYHYHDELVGEKVDEKSSGFCEVGADGSVQSVNMKIPDVVDHLIRYDREQEEEIAIEEKIDAFFMDGAVNFQRAMAELFGKTFGKGESSFFGSNPPKMVSVETGVDEVTRVPWGSFSIPGVDGTLKTTINAQHGWPMFAIEGTVKKKHEAAVKAVADRTRELVSTHSIYKGKALDIRLPDPEEMLENPFDYAPKFLSPTVNPDDLLFNQDIQDTIRCFMFSFVEHTKKIEAMGEQAKRGVLIAGDPGVGKTMLSSVLARKCIDNGWTFLYVKNINELPRAVEFARGRFEPAVVFAEDLDRLVGEERTDAANEVLNTVDGINTKGNKIMLVVTTNHLDQINEVMLRPGRLDVIIPITPPDATTVEKLIRRKAGALLAPKEDISEVCNRMAGTMPAVITELVCRAKLAAFDEAHTDDWPYRDTISNTHLLAAANTLVDHAARLMKKKEVDKRSDAEKAAGVLSEALLKSQGYANTYRPAPYPRTKTTV